MACRSGSPFDIADFALSSSAFVFSGLGTFAEGSVSLVLLAALSFFAAATFCLQSISNGCKTTDSAFASIITIRGRIDNTSIFSNRFQLLLDCAAHFNETDYQCTPNRLPRGNEARARPKNATIKLCQKDSSSCLCPVFLHDFIEKQVPAVMDIVVHLLLRP